MYQILQTAQDRRDYQVAKDNGVSLTDYKHAKCVLAFNDSTDQCDLQRMAIISKAKELKKRSRGL